VLPTPLPKPKLVIHSPAMAKALGISEEECASEAFVAFFSGEQGRVAELQSWCTPYALSIMGRPHFNNCPFGNGNGYGDGRAVSVGEVVVEGRRWEMQLKGGGTTPFCRGADGRAVLRSSVREFIASEAMHNMGVETTRALSLIVSGSETTQRPWYSRMSDGPGVWDPDTRITEPCAITTRVAPSFLRVGHVDLFARRARATGGEEQRAQHRQMVEHALFREYPDLAPDAALEERALALLSAAADRLGAMVAGWLRVGYCQGNFNGDNCLVGGRTMDYGPFGFIEEYDPLFAKWTGSGQHFAFMSQPEAAAANYKTLVDAVAPVFGKELRQRAEQAARKGTEAIFAKAEDVWRAKMGLSEAAAGTAKELWRDLEPLMRRSKIDYTVFWRQLAAVAERQEGAGDILEPLRQAFYSPPEPQLAAKWEAWLRRWLGSLGGLAVGAAVRISGIQQRPELNGQIGTVKLWNAQKERWGVCLHDGSDVALKEANLEEVAEGAAAGGAPGGGGVMAVARRMRATNPKYVPREWMLVQAYERANHGDFGLVHELYGLFLDPYGEQPELEKKYFKRAPPEALTRGGCAKMS